MVRLIVPKEIRDEVRAQPARKRFRRKLRIIVVSEFSLALLWLVGLAVGPADYEVFVIYGALVTVGVFMVIWTWKDLKEMREFEKALWAKYESEHQSVNTENNKPKPS